MSSKSEKEFKKWASRKLLRSLEKNKHEALQELYDTMNNDAPRELLEGYKFHSQADDKVCERCAPLHGMVFSIIDEAHLPPLHPDCRCYAKAVLLDPISMEEFNWGGSVTFSHASLTKTEYGYLEIVPTQDAETLLYHEAVGFIDRVVSKTVKRLADAVIELIDEHFR